MRLNDQELDTVKHMTLSKQADGWHFRVPIYITGGVAYNTCGGYLTKDDADEARRSYSRTVTQGVKDGEYHTDWWKHALSGPAKPLPCKDEGSLSEDLSERPSGERGRYGLDATAECDRLLVIDEPGQRTNSLDIHEVVG